MNSVKSNLSERLQVQREFYNSLESPEDWLKFFRFFSHTLTCVKNLHSQFVYGTDSFLKICGLTEEEEVIGHTDRAFFPLYLAEQYIEEDKLVFSGQHIVDKKWLVPERKGVVSWCVSSKIPVKGKTGEIIGLCCTLNNFYLAEDNFQQYAPISKAISFIEKNYFKKISVKDCADIVNCSEAQLNRNFRKGMNSSVGEYIMRVRINAACNDLQLGQLSITDVAHKCGFYDASHFTKQFKKIMHMSPLHYQRRMKS